MGEGLQQPLPPSLNRLAGRFLDLPLDRLNVAGEAAGAGAGAAEGGCRQSRRKQ